MTSRDKVEELYPQLSPQGQELFDELSRRSTETNGEIPRDEMEAFAERVMSLPEPEPQLFYEAAGYEAEARREAPLVEEAASIAEGGLRQVIARAAELTGRDPKTLTVGEAMAILERYGEEQG